MSRCFPFPPPGYGKKAITDEVDLLKKEKQKEKKHKKDKKDKEKRESKEKREKEGRDGKHKEKKDKKEKHREKKKDKDKDKDKSRDKDKSKLSTADDKGFPRQAEGLNTGKLHQKEVKQDDKKGILFENRLTKQYAGNNGEKAREKNHLAEENKGSKFLLELDRRIRNDDRGADNQLFHKFPNTNHRKDEGTVRLVAKGGGTRPDGNEKLKDMGLDVKMVDGGGIHDEVWSIGNALQNHVGNFHPRVDGIPKLLGKYFEGNLEATVEGKEKVKEKKDEKEKAKEKTEEGKIKEKKDEGKERVKEKKDDKRRDKRKDKEKEKKGHGKDKDRDKEKKKEEKAKEHSELKTEQNKLKESNKIGFVDSNSFTQPSRNSHENTVRGENLKKRKDIESNGVPRVNDSLPNKFPKLSSSHPFTENGRILEPFQICIPNASDRPRVATSVKVERKESKVNGIIESQPFAASSNKTHTATVPADLVTEASAKPPHRDAKYLDQVYSVPKVEQWSDFDDQEWLFGSDVSQERKSVVISSEVGETPQVWAEALHIEPADVFALPYVIPY